LNAASPTSGIRNPKSGFTLVEILVAMGVFIILGTALVGLMAAAVDSWRRGEAGRLVNERLQALQRQIADDLAAAVLDQPPPPDFHFALDTLYDLPTSPSPGDPYAILDTGLSSVNTHVQDVSPGRELTYFAPTTRPGTATVVLRLRVPFVIGAALLQARTDVFDKDSAARVWVACNNPAAVPPEDPEQPPPNGDARWKQLAWLQGEGLGGAETDVSAAVLGGTIVFVKAELDNQSDSDDTVQFLRSDRMRAGGRPVLILDCYRDVRALPQQPRPTFAAFVRNGAQVLTFTRTLPPELEQAAAKTDGSETSEEYLNHADDNNNKRIDESHRPVAGRAQVVYAVRRYHSSLDKPGLGVLRRAFEAPLRQPGAGALDENVLRPNVIALIEEIRGHDFIPHVLHFGASFWGADTTTWEDRADLEPGYDTKYDDSDPTRRRPRPASTEWLSSRYLPEQVQVTVVLEPDRGKRVTTGLGQAIAADFPSSAEATLSVISAQGFDDVQRPTSTFLRDPRHFIKVGDEWLFYSRVGSPMEFVLPGADASRGARGTEPVAHAAGAEVYRGITSVFTVRIPTYHHWER